MDKNKKSDRNNQLKKLRLDMKRDRACPARVSKWLKLMECKNKIFTLEDEIDKITGQLKDRKAGKG